MTSLVTSLDTTDVVCLEEKESSNPPLVCGAWGFVWGSVVAMEMPGSSEAMKKSSNSWSAKPGGGGGKFEGISASGGFPLRSGGGDGGALGSKSSSSDLCCI